MDRVANGLSLVAVRTPTLPPATHTNSWIVGEDELLVVDPASPYDDERARLFGELAGAIAGGKRVAGLFLTHHHADHVSGAVDLRDRLAAAGHDAPILAHAVTADLVRDRIRVDRTIEDGEPVQDDVVAVFTPGHAPGHLALHHRVHGWIVAGDMVAGVGTIVIDPSEGDLQDYLDSLERLRRLGGTALMPAHGPVLPHPDAVLSFYVAHRHQRSDQVRAALDAVGEATPLELAPRIYPELPTSFHPVAAAQILTHLRWLERHGAARPREHGRWAR
jgi:glyoxylase-like metal-dependent hydrolase (beta-lactamase superfamily II)